MPELPEVETIRRQLQCLLPGRCVATVGAVDPFVLLRTSACDLCSVLPGLQLQRVMRRGKFLLLALSSDVWLTLHLGMTGQVLLRPYEAEASPYDRLVLTLAPRGSIPPERLIFRDMRKFGRLELSRGGPSERLAVLGPDAWQGYEGGRRVDGVGADPGSWDAGYLAERLRGRRAPIKALLLDQRILAGIGNIYADEALFTARIAPARAAGSLSHEEVRRLAEAIGEVLGEGIAAQGCSISDFVDVDGRPGGMQRNLRAYGRGGESCVRCGAVLLRRVIGGRGTSFCPTCQR